MALTSNAKKIYSELCGYMDARKLRYKKFDEDLTISCTIQGDDIPMEFVAMVREKQQVISLISPLPFKMPENKRIDAAVAVCTANYGLINGTFDYDLSDGEIRFRLVIPFMELDQLGEDIYTYMLGVSMNTIDNYNDRFLMLAKGIISLEQFIEAENEG